MVKDHKSDASEFKQEAQSTQNPQLKQMVMQSDQIIESHLQQIQQIAQTKGTAEGKDVIAVFGKNRLGARRGAPFLLRRRDDRLRSC